MLRSDRRIGSELEEHPHAAGGITDLSFRRVRLELKVESDQPVTCQNAQPYLEQTVQYVVGSDRRFGLLCVLDCSDKTAAPGSAAPTISSSIQPTGRAPGCRLALVWQLCRETCANRASSRGKRVSKVPNARSPSRSQLRTKRPSPRRLIKGPNNCPTDQLQSSARLSVKCGQNSRNPSREDKIQKPGYSELRWL
jgi:hypothetical protein